MMAILFALGIRYQEQKTEVRKQDVHKGIFEKSAIPPSLLIFFITFTFGGIAAFLPIYTMQKDISGIYLYFVLYAVSLLIARIFGEKYMIKKAMRRYISPVPRLLSPPCSFWPGCQTALFFLRLQFYTDSVLAPSSRLCRLGQLKKRHRGDAEAPTQRSFPFSIWESVSVHCFRANSLCFRLRKHLLYLSVLCCPFCRLIFILVKKRTEEKGRTKRKRSRNHPAP